MATYSTNFAITLELIVGYASLAKLIKQLTNGFDVTIVVDANVDFQHAFVIASAAISGLGGLATAVALGRTSTDAFKNRCFVEGL